MIEAIALLLAASLAFTLVGIGVLFLHRILLGSSSDFEGREVSASTSFRISAIYSLVLGLIFSGVSNQFTEAQRNIHQQAIQIGKVHSLADLYGTEEAQFLQVQLRALLEHSIYELKMGEVDKVGDSTTNSILADVQNAARQLSHDGESLRILKEDILVQVSRLRDLRLERFVYRLGNATPGFWVFYVIGFILIIFCFGAFAHSRKRSVYVGLFCIFVGITAFFIYGLSSPFSKPINVSEAAFLELLRAIERN